MGEKAKVKMETKTETIDSKKLNYEDLEKYAVQASQQIQYFQKEFDRLNNANFHQRMAYLFKVVELPTMFSDNFVIKCSEEIEEVLTIPKESDTEPAEIKEEK